MLLTGGFDSVINCYRKLEFEESGKLKNSIDLVSMRRIHFETITDILVIESHNYIVACDLEGVITLWNLSTLDLKNQLRQHCRGVLSLAFIEGKNILLSAGYEHEVINNNYYNIYINFNRFLCGILLLVRKFPHFRAIHNP